MARARLYADCAGPTGHGWAPVDQDGPGGTGTWTGVAGTRTGADWRSTGEPRRSVHNAHQAASKAEGQPGGQPIHPCQTLPKASQSQKGQADEHDGAVSRPAITPVSDSARSNSVYEGEGRRATLGSSPKTGNTEAICVGSGQGTPLSSS